MFIVDDNRKNFSPVRPAVEEIPRCHSILSSDLPLQPVSASFFSWKKKWFCFSWTLVFLL